MQWHSRRGLLECGGLAVAGVAGLAGCSQGPGDETANGSATGTRRDSRGDVTVAVGSKQFTENELLGHIAYEQLAQNTDLTLENSIGYGDTQANYEGLVAGEIDIYWEYTGTMWHTHPPQKSERIGDIEAMYSRAKTLTESNYELTMLDMAPFNNTYTLTTTQSWVDETGVETISDLAEYINSGNTDTAISIGDVFSDRPDGWPGLLDHYGFEDSAVTAWDDQKGNIHVVEQGLTYEEMLAGHVDIAMGFRTDPQISVNDLVLLADDEDFWSCYSPAPVVRNSTLEVFPELEDQLNPVGPTIGDEQTMRQLNADVDIDGHQPSAVAEVFLDHHDLLSQ